MVLDAMVLKGSGGNRESPVAPVMIASVCQSFLLGICLSVIGPVEWAGGQEWVLFGHQLGSSCCRGDED